VVTWQAQVAATLSRHTNGVDEQRVEDDEGHEGDTEHEDDVQPGMIQLLEHATLAKLRQIVADDRHVLGVGQHHGGPRRAHHDCAVLEELGEVERDAGDDQGGDDALRSADRAERLRLERMTDHDVAVYGECERQPHGPDLECDRRRV